MTDKLAETKAEVDHWGQELKLSGEKLRLANERYLEISDDLARAEKFKERCEQGYIAVVHAHREAVNGLNTVSDKLAKDHAENAADDDA